MHTTLDRGFDNRIRLAIVLGLVLVALILGRFIGSGSFIYPLVLLFSGVVLFLFHEKYEFFILFVLIINQEFFYLIPRPGAEGKDYEYQVLLYLVIVITGVWYFLREKHENTQNFTRMVYYLLVLIVMGVLTAFYQGQPLLLGVSASRGYLLILFYFVFITKKIDTQKLFKLIVVTGVFVSFINNVQYLLHERINIFFVSREMQRVGQLRFMVGGVFVIFASLLALGEYLKNNKKIYLVASLYMPATVVIQGQTRAIIGGVFATFILLLVLARKINLTKALVLSAPLLVFMLWLLPLIQSTYFGELFELTRYEIGRGEGTVGVRLETYSYYSKEIMKSPVVGRGIWNEHFRENNPQDVKYKGFYISDIGIMDFIFNFGLIGAIWLIALYRKVYKLSFHSLRNVKEGMHYGFIGYFIFILTIMPTLNRITHFRDIVFLALVLALLSQLDIADQETQVV